jgi:predicted MFS family arabinose efflux permease
MSERPRLLGLLGAAFGVGFVVGPALGGLSSLGGEHLPFYVAGTIALVNAVVAWIRLPETRPAEARDAARRSGSDDGAVRLWGLAIAGFTAIVAFSGFEATFSLLAGDRFDLTEGGVAAVFVGVGLVLVGVQAGLVRVVSSRIGSDRSLQIGLVLNIGGLAALWWAEQWTPLIVALLLLTVGQGLVTPNLTTIVSGRVPDDRRGEALGFQQGVNAFGRVAGPALAGVLYDHVSVGSPYLVGAALCGIALLVASTTRLSHS